MNLIGHLACARFHEPAFQLGSVLPDLLGMFARRPRANHLVKFWQAWGGGIMPDKPAHTDAVIAGIRFHHHVDARFHGAPLFRDNAAALRKALQSASGEKGLKRFFAAHILLELYFDRFLLEAFPDMARRFDELLAGGQEGLLWRFAAVHPDVDGEALRDFAGRLLENRFVEGYLSDAGVIFRVNRVLGRLGQRELNEPESHTVVSYFEEAGPLRVALLEFVRAMQRHQPAPHSPKSRGEAIMTGAEAGAPVLKTPVRTP